MSDDGTPADVTPADDSKPGEGGDPKPNKVTVPFRACWGMTSDRATGAVLILEPAGDNTFPGATVAVDEDGDCDVDLDEGEWSCTAIHPDGRPHEPKLLKVPADVHMKPGQKVELRLLSLTRDISQKWGTWTFAILIALLTILVGAWLDAHRRHPDPAVPSRASAILDWAAKVKADLAEADDPRKSESFPASIKELGSHLDSSQLKGEPKKQLNKAAKQQDRLEFLLLSHAEKVKLELRQLEVFLGEWHDSGGDTLEKAKKALEKTKDEAASSTSPRDIKSLMPLVEQLAGLRAGIQDDPSADARRNNLNGYEQKLRALAGVREEIAEEQLIKLVREEVEELEGMLPELAAAELKASKNIARSVFWSKPPKLYLEIWFWATAGILVQLIITVAGYLRGNRFIKTGIYLHTALVITVPLMTLVFVQVVSMARLTADDSTVVLDLSDPRIVAGAAFLIALVPWRLWGRIQGAGRQLLGGDG